jgi:hypothetical protein
MHTSGSPSREFAERIDLTPAESIRLSDIDAFVPYLTRSGLRRPPAPCRAPTRRAPQPKRCGRLDRIPPAAGTGPHTNAEGGGGVGRGPAEAAHEEAEATRRVVPAARRPATLTACKSARSRGTASSARSAQAGWGRCSSFSIRVCRVTSNDQNLWMSLGEAA